MVEDEVDASISAANGKLTSNILMVVIAILEGFVYTLLGLVLFLTTSSQQ